MVQSRAKSAQHGVTTMNEADIWAEAILDLVTWTALAGSAILIGLRVLA